MPIYEYLCSQCKERCEFLQRMDDAPKTECPKCASAALVRCISSAGFRLSGSGYYETDEKPADKQRNTVRGDDS